MLLKREKEIDARYSEITAKPLIDENKLKGYLIKGVIVVTIIILVVVVIKKFI